KTIVSAAEQTLLSMLPEEFHDDFAPYRRSPSAHEEDAKIVKQADSICAYLKCLEELSAGNHEFALAKKRLDVTLQERRTPEMDYFLNTFAPSFELSLDEIS
ncbi:5'-deoxynucleotidase, partial [Vibrio parahaemolyticus]|nr:5'-deoxynucleotidase [Vibrio parahaemolyticus]